MSEQNIQTVKEIYATFQRGDIASIMKHVSDDLEGFGIISERELIPWHIQISKKADVPKFFQAGSKIAEFTRFETHDFASGGDYVYCTCSFDAVFRRNNRKVTVDVEIHRFKFKDGKVVEWRGTEDTARISEEYNAVLFDETQKPRW
jgi:ketosteroid isomerase-like protein